MFRADTPTRSRTLTLLAAITMVVSIAQLAGAEEAATYFEEEKLSAPDATFNVHYGTFVGADEQTLVIGSALQGCFIYEYDAAGPSPWVLVDTFDPELACSLAAFDGDTILLGAPGDSDVAPQAGAAYVFVREPGLPGSWQEVAKLTAEDGAFQDFLGSAVAVSGDTAVVGAPSDDDHGFASGSAYVFERNAGGPDGWGQVAKLVAPDGDERANFGDSLAIDGDTIAVGAALYDEPDKDAGAVYLFQRDVGGPGAWGIVAKLVEVEGEREDLFGDALVVAGDTVVVGAPGRKFIGATYVFREDAGGPGAWGEVAVLKSRDGQFDDDFGSALDLDGDTLVVGAPGDNENGSRDFGAAYIYRRDLGGPDAWGQLAKITASDRGTDDHFGDAVAIARDTVIAGAAEDNNGFEDSGSAYVFRESAIDPQLEIIGRCPGEITLTASGATPHARIEIRAGRSEGLSTVSSGVCVGAELDLDPPVSLLRTKTASPNGHRSQTRNVRADQCGALLQLVDLTTCATSDLLQTP